MCVCVTGEMKIAAMKISVVINGDTPFFFGPPECMRGSMIGRSEWV